MALYIMKWAMELAKKTAVDADEEMCKKLFGLKAGLINTNLDLGKSIIAHRQRMNKIMAPKFDLEEEDFEKKIHDCQSSAKYILRKAENDIKAKVDLIKVAFSEHFGSDLHLWGDL